MKKTKTMQETLLKLACIKKILRSRPGCIPATIDRLSDEVKSRSSPICKYPAGCKYEKDGKCTETGVACGFRKT